MRHARYGAACRRYARRRVAWLEPLAPIVAASSALACLRAAVAAVSFEAALGNERVYRPTWRVLKGAHAHPGARVWLPLLILSKEEETAARAGLEAETTRADLRR